MGGFAVRTCVFCGKLFQSLGTSACPACSEKLDSDFRVVREYIYNVSGNVSVRDIVDNTDVSEKAVLFLIKEGRLSEKKILTQNGLTCSACGTSISEGKFCAKCLSVLKAGAMAQNTGSKQGQPEIMEEKPGKNQRMHTCWNKEK